jgi:hypothetical protein
MSDDEGAAAKQLQSTKASRTVSRAPAPAPRVEPSSWSPPKPSVRADHLKNLEHALWQCEGLIRAARTLRRFRGSLWDAEKKRWDIYRPQIGDGLRLCREAGLSDHREFIGFLPRIEVLDREWAVACELRQAGEASSEQDAARKNRIAAKSTRLEIAKAERSDAFASMIRSAEQIRAKDEAWQEHALRVEIERSEEEVREEQELHADIEKSVLNPGHSSRPLGAERTAAVDRVVLVPPCSVDVEGYTPFSWAVYWMVPKEVIDSKAGIKVGTWEAGCSKLVSWIGSKKVTLIGRRPGEGENKPLPPELLANHPVVDWGLDSFGELDGSRKHLALPWPNTPFLRLCYCPDYEHWQRGEFNDQFFNTKHRIEWTHLQVNMIEVVAALEASFKPNALAETEVGEAKPSNRDTRSLDCVWQVSFDAGDVPLFEAVHWIATKGGSVSFDPNLWPEAWAKIASAWRKDKLTVSGRPFGRPVANNSFPEKISGNEIAGVRCIPPYPCASLFGDPSSGTGPCIEFWGRSDRLSWEERGFNDKLYVPGHGGWTHLTVLRADIEGLWPFGLTAQPEADGIDPVGHEHREPNVLEIAKTFVRGGIAPNAREHTTLVMSVLKKEHPGNHPKREEVEKLLTAEFKNHRRSRGRTIRPR